MALGVPFEITPEGSTSCECILVRSVKSITLAKRPYHVEENCRDRDPTSYPPEPARRARPCGKRRGQRRRITIPAAGLCRRRIERHRYFVDRWDHDRNYRQRDLRPDSCPHRRP